MFVHRIRLYTGLLGWMLLSLGLWQHTSCSQPASQESVAETPDVADGSTVDTVVSEGPGEQRYTLGDFQIEVTKTRWRILRGDGKVLLESPTLGQAGDKTLPALLGWRKSDAVVTANFGMYLFDESQAPAWTAAQEFQVSQSDSNKLTIQAGQAATATISRVDAHVLRVHWKLSDAANNRVIQSFACGSEERFFGLGAKVHGSEHRGEVMPAWVSEQGIDKIRRTTPTDGFPIKGDIHDAYLAVPYVMSSRGVGLLVESTHRSVFHLCAKDAPDRWSVELWHGELQYLVIQAAQPLALVERLTAITGRPRLLPKWALAPWMDALYGQDNVLQQANKLRKEKIAAAVIWTEDWVGAFEDARGYHLNYQWIADEKLYPDLKKLSGELHARGFKFFGYFNSFIQEGFPHWKEAVDDNHVIRDKDGKPLQFSGVFFKPNTLPDLTRPETVKWVQGFMKKAMQLGFDGWMADYGEWLPLEAKMHDGRSGWEVHNQYPVLWQKLNREVWDQERPDGDYVFFARSGWTGTGGIAPVVWAGDQQTEFGGGDGMRSVIPIAINSGISGIPVMTHEIAGYSSIGVPPSTKELFFRWTQLSAFSSIMRTHHGSLAKQNWHWDKDTETIEMFRRYTQLHLSMFPYRYAVAQAASQKGWPMMRHLYLHYPDDPNVARIDDQFLLGDALLVAPIQQEKATQREVYLPQGRWYHFFTGQGYEGGKKHNIEAGVTEIPVFARAGAILPEFGEKIDTLAKATEVGIVDITRAESGMLGVRMYLGANGTFDMYDGTRFTLEHQTSPPATPDVQIDNKAWPTCQGNAMENCVRSSGKNGLEVFVSNSKGFALTAKVSDKVVFSAKIENAPNPRNMVLRVWW